MAPTMVQTPVSVPAVLRSANTLSRKLVLPPVVVATVLGVLQPVQVPLVDGSRQASSELPSESAVSVM